MWKHYYKIRLLFVIVAKLTPLSIMRVPLAMEAQGEDFSEFIWQFVDGKPIDNQWQTISQVPAFTEISDDMAKALKKKGLNLLVLPPVMHLCKQ